MDQNPKSILAGRSPNRNLPVISEEKSVDDSRARVSFENSSGGPFRRKKISKRGKRKVKSKSVQDKDMESFKPAPLNNEYVTELGKITKILKAVQSTETGIVDSTNPNAATRVKQAKAAAAKSLLDEHAMSRPLSGDELKQLLSSITRVVSLHQLDGTGSSARSPDTGLSTQAVLQKSTTNVQQGDLAGEDKSTPAPARKKTRKRRSRKVKRKGTSRPPNIVKEPAGPPRSRALIFDRFHNRNPKASITNKTKDVVKPLRKVRTNVIRNNKPDGPSPRRPYSEGSSITSLDKDPIQNAVFLRKYYEETTRLANKRSSDELVAGAEASNVEGKDSKSSKQKNNLKPVKSPIASNKTPSKKSIPTAKQASGHSSVVQASTVASRKSASAASKTKVNAVPSTTTQKSISKTQVRKRSSIKRKSRATVKAKESSTSSRGSTRPISSARSKGDGENISKPTTDLKKVPSLESETLKAISRSLPDKVINAPQQIRLTVNPNPTSGPAGRPTEQFKNIEEIINSSNVADAAKMKSIWEKTPYQPMTHARFKDMVSKYASPEATVALAKGGDIDKPMPMSGSPKIQSVVSESYKNSPSPGTHETLKISIYV